GRIRGALRSTTSGLVPVSSTSVGASGAITSVGLGLSLTGTRVANPSLMPPGTTTFPDASTTRDATAGDATVPDAGPSCTAATTGGGHGTCATKGTCTCNRGFIGAASDRCATNFYGSPACRFCDAATTCTGHGTCGATGCTCNPGFAGTNCDA